MSTFASELSAPSTTFPIINAHRGAVYQAVENTLHAFSLAIEQGARSLELDVVRLKSGELVVFHGGGNHENPGEVSQLASHIMDRDTLSSSSDSTFLPFSSSTSSPESSSSYSSSSSTSSFPSTVPESDPLHFKASPPSHATYSEVVPNTLYIEEMTLEQVKRLKFSPTAPGIRSLLSISPPSLSSSSLLQHCETASIPLLTDVLDLCKSTDTHIALELKGTGIEHDCLTMVEESGMIHNVTFSSFHPNKTNLIRRMRCDMERVKTAKIFDTPLPRDWIEQTRKLKCNEAHICFADTTPQAIELAHRNGIKVMAWFPHPINDSIWSKFTEDAALYAQVAKSGVDIMCVNKPDLLKEVLDGMTAPM